MKKIRRLLRRCIYFLKDEDRKVRNLPRYHSAQVLLNGKIISIVDNITFLHGRDEIFNSQLYAFKTYTDAPVILDCGANIGLSVIFFKTLFPNAEVIAFEPDPSIASVLRSNVASFELKNVTIHEVAIWSKDGHLDFQQEGGFSGSITNFWNHSHTVKVKTLSLNPFLNRKVHFLKIDIEGAEFEVLKSIKNNLNQVENIFIEYHSPVNENQTLHEILKMLFDAGFRYHIKEAFVRGRPYIDKDTMLNMDLQLNIFGYRV